MKGASSEARNLGAVESGEAPREALVSRGGLTLRFLFNQRTRSMRIIDFRAGSHPDKLALVQEVAEREGMERAYTLVEREEAPTWAKMGFAKEGTIPGFYKRSDAHVLGLNVAELPRRESAVRIRISAEEEPSERSDRIYQEARKAIRQRGDQPLPTVKVSPAREQDAERAFHHVASVGRELTDFSPFGRDVERRSYLFTARGGFSLLVGVEIQPCFDNAMIELLSPPRGDKEQWMMAGGLNQLCDQLVAEGIVSVFSTTPAESVEMTAILLAAGFRKTGLMPGHLRVGGKATNAQLWSRKLAEPV